MENLLIITFPDATHAYGGLNQLKDLDQLGDITIYNYAMIHKSGTDRFDLGEHFGPDTDNLPAVGALGGSLIGVIAGPLGVAIGMLTGVMAGSLDEDDALNFSDSILDRAKENLKRGEFALVLDAEEVVDDIVNSYIKNFQGTIGRTDIASKYEDYDNEQWAELNLEIDQEERSLKTALDKDKAAIGLKIQKLKKERDEKFQKLKLRFSQKKQKLETSIKAIDIKIKTANARVREDLKSKQEKLENKLNAMNAKLDQAFA